MHSEIEAAIQGSMSRRGRGQAPSRGFSTKKFNSVLQHGFGGSSRSPIGNVGATANEPEKDNRLLKSAGLATSGSSSSIKAATTNVTSNSTAQFPTSGSQQQWSSLRMKSIPSSSKPQSSAGTVTEVETSKSSKQQCAADETDMKNEQHAEDEILYPPMEFKPPKPSADSETEQLVPIKNALYAEFRAQNSYFLKSGDHLPPVFIEGFRPVNSKSIIMNWKFIPVELRSPEERKKAIEKIKAARMEKRKRKASTDKPLPTNKFSRTGALPEPVIKRLEFREKEESENVKNDDNKNDDEEINGKKQNEEEEEEDENKLEEDDFYDEDMDFYHFDDDEDNYGLADDDGDDEGPIY